MTTATDRDIVSERVFDAPADALWQAFANPQSLARWWGPEGFTNRIDTFDLKPGGHWQMTMVGPNGHEYPNHAVFDVVDAPRAVKWHRLSAPLFDMEISVQPEGSGRARMRWVMHFESAAERDKLATVCIPANEQNFDRLAADLARKPS